MKEFFKFASESPFLTFFLFLVIFGSLSEIAKHIFCKCDEPETANKRKITDEKF